MTLKHMMEGVMQHMGARNPNACGKRLGLDTSLVYRVVQGQTKQVWVDVVDQIQRDTKIPFDQLFEWYRLPEGARLPPKP